MNVYRSRSFIRTTFFSLFIIIPFFSFAIPDCQTTTVYLYPLAITFDQEDGLITIDSLACNRCEYEYVQNVCWCQEDCYDEEYENCYVDSNENEKVLTLNTARDLKAKTVNSKLYNVDEVLLEYIDDSIHPFTFHVTGTGSYNPANEQAQLFVNGGLSQFNTPTFHHPSISIDQEGNPHICKYESSVTLLGKTFSDVFTNIILDPEIESYTEIYYSSAGDGLVAFRDFDNELWVLDRYQ